MKIINNIVKGIKDLIKEIESMCPNCGSLCTGKSIYCIEPENKKGWELVMSENTLLKKELRLFECECKHIVTFDSNKPDCYCKPCGQHYTYSFTNNSVRKVTGGDVIKTIAVEQEADDIVSNQPFPQYIPMGDDSDISIYQNDPYTYFVSRQNLKDSEKKDIMLLLLRFNNPEIELRNGIKITELLSIIEDRVVSQLEDGVIKKQSIMLIRTLKETLAGE